MGVRSLVSETRMWSIHPKTGVPVRHDLPYSRDSNHIKRYLAEGFTFEEITVKIIKDAKRKPAPLGYYFCTKCESNHRGPGEKGTMGYRHRKYREGLNA